MRCGRFKGGSVPSPQVESKKTAAPLQTYRAVAQTFLSAVPQTLQWEGTGTVPRLRTWPPTSLEPWDRGALSSGKVLIPAMIGDLLERVPPMDVPPSEELASEETRSY